MKNQLLGTLFAAGITLGSVPLLLANNQVNVGPTSNCTDFCGPCQDCNSQPSGDGVISALDSIFLTFNLGGASLERPTNFASIYAASVANRDEDNYPQGFSSIQSYFEKAPMQNLWKATLAIKTADITSDSFKPSSLTYNHAFDMEVLTDNNVVRQVLTHEFLVDVQSLASPEEGFKVNWYFSEDKGNRIGGYYQPSGDPVKTVIVSNPNVGRYEKLDVSLVQDMPSETTRALYTRYHFRTPSGSNPLHTMETWTAKPEDTGAKQIAEETIEYLSGAPVNGAEQLAMDRVRTSKIANYDSNGWGETLSVVSRVREVYSDIGGKSRMTKLIKLSSETDNNAGLATTYGYFDSPNRLLHGLPKWQKNYDGSWVVWQITANESTQSISKITPFKDGIFVLADDGSNVDSVIPAEARVEQQTINATSMDSIVKVMGITVARIDEDFTTGGAGERVTTTRSYSVPAQNNGRGSYFDTVKAYFPYGDGSSLQAGRLAWETYRDGTATVYDYEEVAGDLVKVTQHTGAAVGLGRSSAPTITAGMKTVMEYNEFWEVVSEENFDIATTKQLDFWTSDGNEDMYGRWTSRFFNGDTGDYETRTFGCCGPVNARSRYGATTTTSYDLLKRVYLTSTKQSSGDNAIVTTNVRNGLVKITSVSAGTISFDTSKTEFNLVGETINSWSADANGDNALELTTILTEYPTGGGRKVTQTNPKSGTSISMSYRDGRQKTLSGTAVVGRSYDYGSFDESFGNGMWTQMTVANDTEWTKTYSDALGRSIRTGYPDGAYSERTYYSSSGVVGARGKLSTMKDADETTAPGSGTSVQYSYGYNSDNQAYSTITEQLPDSQTRVTTTTSGVVPDATDGETTTQGITIKGTLISPAIFRTTVVNSVKTNSSYRSSDGYTSGSVSFGNENLTQRSKPTAATSGNWSLSSVTTDGQTSLETYSNGQLQKTELFDNQGTAAANLLSSTSYTYDELNRTESVTDSRMGTVTYSGLPSTGYTPSGNLLGMQDAGSRLTTYTYDELGRRLTTTLPNNTVANTSYTDRSEVRATWGSQTYSRFYVYDGQGRMSELHTWQTEPSLSQATTTPPAGSAKTEWLYDDQRGWLVEKNYDGETDTVSSDPDYTYTDAGRLKIRDWERGVSTTFTYEYGLLVETDYSDDTVDVTYEYDNFGRLDTVAQGGNEHVYVYDADLRLDTETVTYDLDEDGVVDFTRVLDRSLDGQLRPDGWQLENGGAVEHAASYGYDEAGRLEHVDPSFPLPTAPAFTYGYEDNSYSLVSSVTGPAHSVDYTWENDRNVLLNKVNHTGALTEPTSKFDYAINEAPADGANAIGQRRNLTATGSAFDTALSDTAAIGPAYTWSYNSRGELIAADDTSPANDDRSFQYDAIGNREKAAESLTLPSSPNYVANALNQYTTANDVVLQNTPYDEDGNLIDGTLPVEAGNATLDWDAENRLIEVSLASGSTAIYRYDYLGRRISKQTGTSAVEFYLYDGWNLIAEYSGDTLVKSYTWGMDLSGSMQAAGGVGGLLAVGKSGASYYPTYDGNGNVSEYLGTTGSVEAHYEYDAFGNTTNAIGGKQGDFRHRFSTKPLDLESGLYYYGYRYYDPVTGRWPSRDPIGERGGVNLYGFVRNDGIGRLDILGQSLFDLRPNDDGASGAGGGASQEELSKKLDEIWRRRNPGLQDEAWGRYVCKLDYGQPTKICGLPGLFCSDGKCSVFWSCRYNCTKTYGSKNAPIAMEFQFGPGYKCVDNCDNFDLGKECPEETSILFGFVPNRAPNRPEGDSPWNGYTPRIPWGRGPSSR